MFPIIHDFGWFSIKAYGLMLAIAFYSGWFLAKRLARKDGIEEKHIDSLSIWIIISAIIGARLLHVIAEEPLHYLKHPLDMFKINQGGLAFYGGMIFAVLASIIYCRRKDINFYKMADIMAPSIALGLAFARIGCFLAGCCYGKHCDLPWAVTFTNSQSAAETGAMLHPTQVYSSLNGIAIFFILILIRKYKRFEGQIFLVFLLIYSVMRSFIEFYRADHRGEFLSLSTSQIISIPIFIWALYMLLKKWRKSRKAA